MADGYVAAATRGLGLLTDAQIRLIDLEILDIASPRLCVLGQLHGSYQEGREALQLYGLLWDVVPGAAVSRAAYYGFIEPYGEEGPLTDAWRKVITEYLAG